jgi:hypothetical protein
MIEEVDLENLGTFREPALRLDGQKVFSPETFGKGAKKEERREQQIEQPKTLKL